MKILVISPYFWPHIGGSQRYMEELYAALLRGNPSNQVDVLAYNTTDAPIKESYRGMTVYRVPCWEPLPGQYAVAHPLALINTLKILMNTQYDVVHTNTRFFETTVWAWILARIIGAKSIITDHVANHPLHPHRLVTTVAKILDKTIFTWSLKRYDLVTATNKKTQLFLKNEFHLKSPALTYGGVDTDFYIPKMKEKKYITVTYAARLIETKGIRLFLKMINDIFHRFPKHTRFLVAGDGPLSGEVQKNNHVLFLGGLDKKKMKKVLQETDIFVHPSYHQEGFPNAILEAAASGCFVIATDNAGTNEIILHKKTGLLIPQKDSKALADAMIWAVKHHASRKAMAKNARIIAEQKFSWRGLVNKFLPLLHSY